MVQRTSHALSVLYEADETAWLEANAQLLAAGKLDQIDPETLAEYLTDMAKRDRWEVVSRLESLLSHLLKWEYQPDRRSGSWMNTIGEQGRELQRILESGTLRNYAEREFAPAYEVARKSAARETELPLSTFPEHSSWTLDDALAYALN